MRILTRRATRQTELDDLAIANELDQRLLVKGKPEGWVRGDGSVVPYRGGRWVLYVTIDGKRRAFYHDTSEQAIEHQRSLRIRGNTTGRTTTDKYLLSWLAAHEARGSLRPKSARRYSDVITRMTPYLKGLPLQSLSPRIVQGMLDKLATESNGRGGKLSPGSVAKVRAVLRAALNAAVAEGHLTQNPAVNVRLPRASRTVPTLWGPDERAKFLVAIKGDRLEALYLTALWQGLREGELIGLRWQDLDLKRGKLTVSQEIQYIGSPQKATVTDLKTQASYRTISLHPTVVAALQALRPKAISGLVFRSTTGTPIEPTNLIRAFHSLLERVGLPRIRFHDLRRLCASQMALDNVPVRVAMHFLGHSSVTTTMNVYASVGDRDEASALAKAWGETFYDPEPDALAKVLRAKTA